jgi:hypothetical protein
MVEEGVTEGYQQTAYKGYEQEISERKFGGYQAKKIHVNKIIFIVS